MILFPQLLSKEGIHSMCQIVIIDFDKITASLIEPFQTPGAHDPATFYELTGPHVNNTYTAYF